MIYADNAATTRMSEAAVHTMTRLFRDAWGNPSSLYMHGQKAKEALEAAREEIAAVIGASPREITLWSFCPTPGSTAPNTTAETPA